MKNLILDNTTFVLVITDDNGYEKFLLSDSYDKCYQYILHEYFDDDENWMKESEDYNDDDVWFDGQLLEISY